MSAPGLILEMRVGEVVCLRGLGGVDSEKIMLILETKDGRKARLRIVASPTVKVSKSEKQAA